MPPTRKRCVQCSLYELPTCSHCLCNGCAFCQKRITAGNLDICGANREGSGAQRLLVLDLEKKQAGLEWSSLVPVAASDGGVGALV